MDSENEYIWNRISKDFDSTRQNPWKEVTSFIDSLPSKSKFLDLGCGNGRHLIYAARKLKSVVGVDISSNLLNIVHKKVLNQNLGNVQLVRSSAQQLPFKNEKFDCAIFIATLHNIKNRENRIKSLKELNRVLKFNGTALISVWTRWQDRFFKYFIKELLKSKIKSKTHNKEFGDILIPWKGDGLNVMRFYHLYSKKEFLKDLKTAKFKIIYLDMVKKNSKFFTDNIFAITEK
jgi:ubiquinone/menaquinone biosynthesis C-methylase UbiE